MSQPFRAKKSFGQHFLVQTSAVAKIVEDACASPAEALLEIGPGPGVLTERLVQDGRPVWAMELDAEACAHLGTRFSEAAHFHLLPGDAVTLPVPELPRSWSVVGNLPYNASTAILARFLMEPIPWERLVFMFQLEVAQKVLGRPSEKAYGPLAVLSQVCTRPSRLLKLGPGAFAPPPKVDSAVVHFDLRADAPSLMVRRRLRTLLFRSFAHRRKTLANNWQSWIGSAETAAALAAVQVSASVRAEALEPAQWLALEAHLAIHHPHAFGAPHGTDNLAL